MIEQSRHTIEVRPAVPADADAIADAHVWGWRVGYRGLFPDEYLDADAFEDERRDRWRRWTWPEHGGPTAQMFVPVLDGRVVGFGHSGPERVEPTCDQSGTGQAVELSTERGEVYGFYLHPDAWGSGVATPLMRACEDHLRASGFRSAVLWVLRDNPRARGFYEKAGWRWSGETGEWPGPATATAPPEAVAEVQYITEL